MYGVRQDAQFYEFSKTIIESIGDPARPPSFTKSISRFCKALIESIDDPSQAAEFYKEPPKGCRYAFSAPQAKILRF